MDIIQELVPYITDYDPSIKLVSAIKFKTGLSESRLYKVMHQTGEFVIKIFPSSYKGRITQQNRIVDFLIANKIPTPKVFKINYNFTKNVGYLIMEFVEGVTLYHILETPVRMQEALTSTAQTLYEIHSLPIVSEWQDPDSITTSTSDWLDFVSKRVSNALVFLGNNRHLLSSEKLSGYLESTINYLNSCEIELAPLHWDYNPQNVLIRDNKVTAVLDLESHRIGDTLNDLGIVWYWFYFYSKEIIFAAFLDAYQNSIQKVINRELVKFYMTLQVISALDFLLKSNKDEKAVKRLKDMLHEIS